MKIDRFCTYKYIYYFLVYQNANLIFSAILSSQIDLCPVLLFFKIYSTYNLFAFYLCYDKNIYIYKLDYANLFISLNLKLRNA